MLMQEDKKLKELLIKHAMEETFADFTNTVMQRIQSAAAAKAYAKPLLKQKLPKTLIVAFILVCIVLIALSIFMQDAQLPFLFSVKLTAKYFSQIISFLIAFWVIMLINQLVNMKKVQRL